MTGLTSGLLRLVTVGIVCGMLLNLGGKGPLREILRFGCACLTVVVLLTVLRQTQLPAGRLAAYEDRLQVQVEQSQQDIRTALLKETQRGLAEELERQARTFSLDCDVSVACRADREGLVTVEGVEISYRCGPRDRLQELRQAIGGQLAIPLENIVVKEEAGT